MSVVSAPPHQPFRGILYKLIAVLSFVIMASLVKAAAAEGVPPGEAVFFRSFFALPVILAWVIWQGKLQGALRVKSPTAHVLRGVVGTAAMGLGFAGLAYLPLPEAIALGYTMPLLVVIFAAMFLKENVGIFRFSAVIIGFVGVGIILAPRLTITPGGVADREALGALLVLMSACFASLAQIHIRNMVQVEQTSAIVFWFSVTSSVLALLTLPFGWVLPPAPIVGLLVVAGLLGGFGQIFLTSSYRFAEASLIAPFEYASMLVSLVIGYFVFQEIPTPQVLIGASVVIAAGVIIILRERHLGLQRAKSRETMTPQG
ncbi:DMT family transporter [Fluviibacterium sp. DFM31]|uniref:DMT family transporter n=1 Tax=Meridianimarinicoccus marinus TaxID=3231483 RepID=A0ABV3LAX8_9RHOB